MGFLDNLKGKAEELGDKAKEGLEVAKDRAEDLAGDLKDRAEDLKDRIDGDEATTTDTPGGPAGETTGAETPGTETPGTETPGTDQPTGATSASQDDLDAVQEKAEELKDGDTTA